MFNKCPKGIFTKISVLGGILIFALLWGCTPIYWNSPLSALLCSVNNADLKTTTWLLYRLRLRSRSPHNAQHSTSIIASVQLSQHFGTMGNAVMIWDFKRWGILIFALLWGCTPIYWNSPLSALLCSVNNADLKTTTWLLYRLRLHSRSPHNAQHSTSIIAHAVHVYACAVLLYA